MDNFRRTGEVSAGKFGVKDHLIPWQIDHKLYFEIFEVTRWLKRDRVINLNRNGMVSPKRIYLVNFTEIPTLTENCYKPGAKTETYSVIIKSDFHCQQMDFQQTDDYKDKIKHRYKIEAKNNELENVHGYRQATSYGLINMQMQGALAIFTVNLKRIIKLTS